VNRPHQAKAKRLITRRLGIISQLTTQGLTPYRVLGSIFCCLLLITGCTDASTLDADSAVPLSPAEVLYRTMVYPDMALATERQSLDSSIAAAEAYTQLGQDAVGLAYAWHAADQSGDLDAWRQLAVAHQATGDWRAARDAWQAVIAEQPADPAAHFWLGLMLVPYDPREAYNHFEIAVQDPEFARPALDLQQHIEAAQLAEPAIQQVQYGIVLAHYDYWLLAEQSFAVATTLEPAYAEAWAYLGLARAQLNKDATAAFSQAQALDVDAALLYLLQGLALRAQGLIEQSVEVLLQAAAAAPLNPAVAAELGTSFRLLGDLAQAEYWLSVAVQLAPGDSQFSDLLAFFYADELFDLQGNGLTALAQAVESSPGDADLQTAYGWALFNAGQVDVGQQTISMARLLQPDNPRALYYQGVIFQQLDQPAAALDLWEQLLDHPAAQGFDVLARRAISRLDG
jgi:Flp pilus assembly protein TadD